MSYKNHSERAKAFIEQTFAKTDSLQNLLMKLEDLAPELSKWQWTQIRLLDGSTAEGCIKDVFDKALAGKHCWAAVALIAQNTEKLINTPEKFNNNKKVALLLKNIDTQAIECARTLESTIVPAYYLEGY